MRVLAGLVGTVVIVVILWDAFETIILPRRVTRRFRLTRLFYHYTWLPLSRLLYAITSETRTENLLSFYGPISLHSSSYHLGRRAHLRFRAPSICGRFSPARPRSNLRVSRLTCISAAPTSSRSASGTFTRSPRWREPLPYWKREWDWASWR